MAQEIPINMQFLSPLHQLVAHITRCVRSKTFQMPRPDQTFAHQIFPSTQPTDEANKLQLHTHTHKTNRISISSPQHTAMTKRSIGKIRLRGEMTQCRNCRYQNWEWKWQLVWCIRAYISTDCANNAPLLNTPPIVETPPASDSYLASRLKWVRACDYGRESWKQFSGFIYIFAVILDFFPVACITSPSINTEGSHTLMPPSPHKGLPLSSSKSNLILKKID